MILRNNTPQIILNGIAIFIYFFIVILLGYEIKDQTMFGTPDSRTYLDVTNWIGSGRDTEHLAIRPLFYPLFLLLAKSIGGLVGIWFFQFILWILSLNLIFISLKKATNSIAFSYLGAGFYLSNISIIAFTFHALTEITTIFFLSVFTYTLTKFRKQFKSFHFYQYILIILVLLTLIKPVFFFPLIGFLIIVSPLFYFKIIFQSERNILKTILILSPFIFQIGLMKAKYNSFSVSTISSKTLNEYILAQGLKEKFSIERDSALVIANNMSKIDLRDFAFQNKKLLLNRFKNNLIGNIISYPQYLVSFTPFPNKNITNFMLNFNKLTYKLHRIGIIIFSIILIVYIKRKESHNSIFILVLFTFNIYYLLATGISFYQGDRLVLPAISIWAFLYPYLIFEFYRIVKQIKPKLKKHIKK